MANLPTHFAPAERTDNETLKNDYAFLAGNNEFHEILNAVPYLGLILNEQRQLVYANQNLFDTIGISGIEKLLGMRPGEILNCVNSSLEPGGCGTSEYCKVCGAVRILLAAISTGKQQTGECRISSGSGIEAKSWDFQCIATPLKLNGRSFIVLSLLDISHEKRRRAMERIFFHDLINTATGLDGLINYVRDVNRQKDTMTHIDIIRRLSKSLIDEIISQREILSAENEELFTRRESVYCLDVVSEAVHSLAYHQSAKGKQIIIDPDSDNVRFVSDQSLVRRVLVNMLKNALEASDDKSEVSIGCNSSDAHVTFWVKNPGLIPYEIQKQIFQRSFSTKGNDRGLGTYSMKLITEKYLGGKVSFISTAENDTIFSAVFPVGE